MVFQIAWIVCIAWARTDFSDYVEIAMLTISAVSGGILIFSGASFFLRKTWPRSVIWMALTLWLAFLTWFSWFSSSALFIQHFAHSHDVNQMVADSRRFSCTWPWICTSLQLPCKLCAVVVEKPTGHSVLTPSRLGSGIEVDQGACGYDAIRRVARVPGEQSERPPTHQFLPAKNAMPNPATTTSEHAITVQVSGPLHVA